MDDRILLLTLALQGCTLGGACDYEIYEGTCTGTEDGSFTFEGEVQGEQVSLLANGLDDPESLGLGETTDCQLELIRTGTCTPCMFDIGNCGADAWDIPLP